MRLGATLVHLENAPPFPVGPWAERLVSAGFQSLWTPHIVGRSTFVPDPFTTLAAAASVTADVEMGTATVQAPLYHPADLAHRVLSLRAICGDRLTLGVSPGSSAADYETLDRDFAGRFPAFRNAVARVRAMLPEEIPVLLGSWGANVERAARDFDGWLASGYRTTPDEILGAHDRYREAGGRRAVVCTVPVRDLPELHTAAAVCRRYAVAGIDDVTVLFAPDGPTPEQVADTLGPVAGW